MWLPTITKYRASNTQWSQLEKIWPVTTTQPSKEPYLSNESSIWKSVPKKNTGRLYCNINMKKSKQVLIYADLHKKMFASNNNLGTLLSWVFMLFDPTRKRKYLVTLLYLRYTGCVTWTDCSAVKCIHNLLYAHVFIVITRGLKASQSPELR